MTDNYKGFVIQPSYKIIEDKAYVYLFGRLSSGESFISINQYNPYFFIKSKDEKIANEIIKLLGNELTGESFTEKTKFVDFNNNKMSKVILNIPKEISTLKRELEKEGVKCYEADLRFEQRFMMDHEIKGTLEIEGEWTDDPKLKTENPEEYYVDKIFLNPKIKPSTFDPRISVLSFDIETNRTAKEIYSIASYFFDKQSDKVITENLVIRNEKVKGAINFETEKEMLTHFRDQILKWDPDMITGWNVIDFDFKVIAESFKRHKVPFDIGRINWRNRVMIANDFMKTSKADIPGRMIVDGIDMVKSNYIKLTDYKLDTAASEIIDDRKLITEDGSEDKMEIIENMFKNKPEDLVKYNQKDAELVIRILDKKELIELMIKRSCLTGMPLDRVNASVATLDSLYIRDARKKGIICSSVRDVEKEEQGKGGYVMEPKPGIYDNVLVLDFKSLYPSIMITFNIDPMSLTNSKDKHPGGLIQAPNGAYFRNEEGILGDIIQKLWHQRDLVKKKGDKVASHAIKIIMNAFYGALGNPGCRFFNLNISNAITYFGQYIIQDTAKLIAKEGYEVLYSDTDSVFVHTKTKNLEDAKKVGLKLEKKMNKHYDKWTKDNYNRDSALELEFEKTYRKIIFPASRGGSGKGAKKRYAGLLMKDGTEKMDFTGLEFVRRDWTEVSKKFQLELLDRVFHEKPVIEFVKQFIKDIKSKKYDNDLVYVKAITKSLSAYTKTTPPHVKAARKLDKVSSNVIKYVMTTDGPEPIQKVTHEIDYDHYIDKQIRPIADSVLIFFDTNLDDLVKGSVQKDLFSF